MHPSCFETFWYLLTWKFRFRRINKKPRNTLPVMLDCSQYANNWCKKYRRCHGSCVFEGIVESVGVKPIYHSSVRKKLSNDHMWFSVLSRPTRSNFTRVQRVSCCASLLFLTMITNCMFFKTEDKVQKPSAIQIGPISFTLSQLFISIVTTAIVFPPSILIVSIFRKVSVV